MSAQQANDQAKHIRYEKRQIRRMKTYILFVLFGGQTWCDLRSFAILCDVTVGIISYPCSFEAWTCYILLLYESLTTAIGMVGGRSRNVIYMLILYTINIWIAYKQQLSSVTVSLCTVTVVQTLKSSRWVNFTQIFLLTKFTDGSLNQTWTECTANLCSNRTLLVLYIHTCNVDLYCDIPLLLHTCACSLGASTLTCINMLMLIISIVCWHWSEYHVVCCSTSRQTQRCSVGTTSLVACSAESSVLEWL